MEVDSLTQQCTLNPPRNQPHTSNPCHSAANATVALLAATAGTALTIVPPLFDKIGPRGCLLIGGWTYPLYSAALLCYNRMSLEFEARYFRY